MHHPSHGPVRRLAGEPNGSAIQQVWEGDLAAMLQELVLLRSSGCTDAGVHVRGMVAAFTMTRAIPPRALSEGLNSLLPTDIGVQDALPGDPGSHLHAAEISFRQPITVRTMVFQCPPPQLLRSTVDCF